MVGKPPRPGADRRGIHAYRTFIAHDYAGTDEEIRWQAIDVQFPSIVLALLTERVHDQVRPAPPPA